jgi:hypothetical protein
MYNYYTIYSRFLRCLNTTTTIDRVCAQNLRPVIFSRTLLFSARLENRTRRLRSLERRPRRTVSHSPALSSVVSFSRARSGTSRSIRKPGRGRSRVVHRHSLRRLLSSFFLKRHRWWCPSAAFPSSTRIDRWRRRNPFASIAPSPRPRPMSASTARSIASDRTRARREKKTTKKTLLAVVWSLGQSFIVVSNQTSSLFSIVYSVVLRMRDVCDF